MVGDDFNSMTAGGRREAAERARRAEELTGSFALKERRGAEIPNVAGNTHAASNTLGAGIATSNTLPVGLRQDLATTHAAGMAVGNPTAQAAPLGITNPLAAGRQLPAGISVGMEAPLGMSSANAGLFTQPVGMRTARAAASPDELTQKVALKDGVHQIVNADGSTTALPGALSSANIRGSLDATTVPGMRASPSSQVRALGSSVAAAEPGGLTAATARGSRTTGATKAEAEVEITALAALKDPVKIKKALSTTESTEVAIRKTTEELRVLTNVARAREAETVALAALKEKERVVTSRAASEQAHEAAALLAKEAATERAKQTSVQRTEEAATERAKELVAKLEKETATQHKVKAETAEREREVVAVRAKVAATELSKAAAEREHAASARREHIASAVSAAQQKAAETHTRQLALSQDLPGTIGGSGVSAAPLANKAGASNGPAYATKAEKLWAYSLDMQQQEQQLAAIALAETTERANETAARARKAAAEKTRAKKKADTAQRTRMRHILIWQLLNRDIAKAQREKFLKMLMELGISEAEYRLLVAKLNTMDEQKIAAAAKAEEPRQAIAIEEPSEENNRRSDDTSENGPVAMRTPTEEPRLKKDAPQRSRAEVYRELMTKKNKL